VTPPQTGPQVIPRPADWRMGAPNPWWGRLTADHVRLDRVVPALERAATRPLPPDLMTIQRPPVLSTATTAAVLAALFEGPEGDTRVLLTRRSSRLRNHSGEVAFPGGKVDPGETLEEAALREAHEEVGLDPRHVRILGRLESIRTSKNPTAVTPIVGIVDEVPELIAHPVEVERIFDAGLLELAHVDCFHEEIWRFPDGTFPVYFFDVPGDTIWGATGRMLHRLLSILIDLD
jgi:8-oxo-dGTP pyrophosphatase MutT (NUDIX family)